MAKVPVAWELGRGVRALRNLVDMLQEASLACRVRAVKFAKIDGSGVYLEGKKLPVEAISRSGSDEAIAEWSRDY